MQQIINVSSYDPKERQRDGRSYSENDVSALRANGASGLIARAGKGGNLDDKCAAFIASADRAGMLPGLYYRVQRHVDPVRQADQFVDRALSLARSRRWNASSLLLCGDYDGDLSLSAITRFMDRRRAAHRRHPRRLSREQPGAEAADARRHRRTRARLAQAPYWLALYSHESGAGPIFPAPGSPEGLVDQYRLWNRWTMWQYGGVDWANGGSRPKVYSHGRYRFSRYFGDLDRPVERNVFKGSTAELTVFWRRHGIPLH